MSSSSTATLVRQQQLAAFSPSREVARMLWERGIELLDVAEISEMDGMARVDYLRELHSAEFDLGIQDGLYRAYRRYEAACKSVVDEVTGERCLRPKWAEADRCLTHATVDDIDPRGAEERRKRVHKARLADMAEKVLDELTEVLADREGEKYPPSIRAKAWFEVLDRSGTASKKSESTTEHTGTVQVEHSAVEIVQARLDRLRSESVDAEIEALEAEIISDSPDPEEGDAA